jgi:hypothetical protein
MARPPHSFAPAWLRSWALGCCLALTALFLGVFAVVTGEGQASHALASSGQSVTSGSQHRLVAAVPNRVEPQLRRDRGGLQELLRPLAYGLQAAHLVAARRAGHAAYRGYESPRSQHVTLFRRRIPRLNSEDPPWG